MPKPPRKTTPPPRRPAPEVLEVKLTAFNEDGIAVGRHENKEVFVPGALAGETVAISVEHAGQRRLVGRLRKVVVRHPERIHSPCGQSHNCLGCPLIALRYSAQLRFKQEKVQQALGAHKSLQAARLGEIWAAPHPLGYRTNAKLVMGKAHGQVKIGLYRRGSHQIVDIGHCPLHHPLINKVVQVVREEVERQEVFIYNPEKKRGLLRYLLVKVSPEANKAMVTFVTAEKDFRQITHLAKWLQKKVPEVVSVQQNVNASEGNVILGRDTLKMLGAPDLLDQVGAVRLRISPASFFQVNNEQAARIYALVRQWAALRDSETAVDLYCGIGGIALHLAKDAGRVIGIEYAEEAVRNARDNARLNDLRNCTFLAGDAAELVQDLSLELPPGSVAVVNPPRSGCAAEVLSALAELKPRALIYVSCNPDTLARDLDLLSQQGYRTLEVQPVDMFPQTPHVESVALLVPGTRPAPRRESAAAP